MWLEIKSGELTSILKAVNTHHARRHTQKASWLMSFGKDEIHVTKKEGQLKPGQNLKCETEILVLIMKNSCPSGEDLVDLIEKWARVGHLPEKWTQMIRWPCEHLQPHLWVFKKETFKHKMPFLFYFLSFFMAENADAREGGQTPALLTGRAGTDVTFWNGMERPLPTSVGLGNAPSTARNLPDRDTDRRWPRYARMLPCRLREENKAVQNKTKETNQRIQQQGTDEVTHRVLHHREPHPCHLCLEFSRSLQMALHLCSPASPTSPSSSLVP